MLNTISKRFFTLCITATTILFSCSSDDKNNDNSNNGNTIPIELPAADLGVYEGVLALPVLSDSNANAMVTLVKTGDKIYEIDFNDDIPSITGIQFFQSVTPNTTFISITDELNNPRVNAIVMDDQDGNRSLIVTIEKELDASNPTVFTSRRKL